MALRRDALTGNIEGQLLDDSKGDALSQLAGEVGVGTDETLAVGSGETDREMLDAAEGICFAPTEGVDRNCEITVNTIERLRDELDGRGLL